MVSVFNMSKICRTCLKEIKNNDYIALDNSTESLKVQVQLRSCVPEVNFHLVENAYMCSECHTTLQKSYLFQKECFKSEQRLRMFVQSKNGKRVSLEDLYSDVPEKNNFTFQQSVVDDLNNILDEVLHQDNTQVLSSNIVKEKVIEVEECAKNDDLLCRIKENTINLNKKLTVVIMPKLNLLSRNIQFVCYYCNKFFCTRFSLRKHIEGFHPKPVKNRTSISSKKSHKNQVFASYKCDYCTNKYYSTRLILYKHIMVFHGNLVRKGTATVPEKLFNSEKNEWNFYKCKYCLMFFKSKLILYKHMQSLHQRPMKTKAIVSSKKPVTSKRKEIIGCFKCNLCDYTGKRRDYVKDHIIRRHKGFQLEKCSVNGYKGISTKLFKCAFCSYVGEKPDLQVHTSNLHTKNQSSTVDAKLQTFTDEHICISCDKKFSFDDFRLHREKHTGQMPCCCYQCRAQVKLEALNLHIEADTVSSEAHSKQVENDNMQVIQTDTTNEIV